MWNLNSVVWHSFIIAPSVFWPQFNATWLMFRHTLRWHINLISFCGLYRTTKIRILYEIYCKSVTCHGEKWYCPSQRQRNVSWGSVCVCVCVFVSKEVYKDVIVCSNDIPYEVAVWKLTIYVSSPRLTKAMCNETNLITLNFLSPSTDFKFLL